MPESNKAPPFTNREIMLEKATYTTVFRWDQKLCDLTTMNTEDMFHFSGKYVPNYDRKIYASRYQVSLIIPS